jgi:hypothetical protein
MKYIFNRFLTILWTLMIVILILISYFSLYFIIHWIIFGTNAREDLIDVGEYLSIKFPAYKYIK